MFKYIKAHSGQDLLYLSALVLVASTVLPFTTEPTIKTVALMVMVVSIPLSLYIIFRKKLGTINFGVPAIMVLIVLFAYYNTDYAKTDTYTKLPYAIFASVTSVFLIIYAAYACGIVPIESLAFAVVLVTLITHSMPALSPFISDPDANWFYRFSKDVVSTGNIIREDCMTYDECRPLPGRFFITGVMGVSAIFLKPLGVSVHDIGMVISGLMAALIVLSAYILMVELFPEQGVNKHIGGLITAMALFGSKGLALRAVASNCEDDGIGLFLMIASMALTVMGLRRKDYKITALASLATLMFALSWAGYEFAIAVIGVLSVICALMSYLSKRSCVEHLPYILIPIAVSLLAGPIMQSDITAFSPPTLLFLVSIGFGTTFCVMLEAYRTRGKMKPSVKYALMAVAVIPFIVSYIQYDSVTHILTIFADTFRVKAYGILDLTTAEAGVGSLSLSYLQEDFGIIYLLGAIMLIPLTIYAIKNRHLGAAFILSFALPAAWAASQMTRFAFITSVPIAMLGGTFAMLLPKNRKEWDGLKVIPIIFLLIIPLTYLPISPSRYSTYGVTLAMSYTASADRFLWDDAFTWMRENTPPNTTMLSWWDYGHWITADAERKSVLDNTKAHDWLVKDVAQWHILNMTWEESRDIACKYHSDYAFIDWSMVSKSGAPHFIATSNMTDIRNPMRGSWVSYATCTFVPEYSNPGGTLTPTTNGTKFTRNLIFVCNNYVTAIEFTFDNYQMDAINVVLQQGGEQYRIPFSAWKKERHQMGEVTMTNMEILGVISIKDILYMALHNPTTRLYDTARKIVIAPTLIDKGVTYDLAENTMSKLYFGESARSYYDVGLCEREWCKNAPNHLKYYTPIPDLSINSAASHAGYVLGWKIDCSNYTREGKNGTG